jgi:DNA helicase HerA-like ATPase
MTVALFGEAVERRFDRGVGQYPTIGDEVHLVTQVDLEVIYEIEEDRKDTVAIGRIAGSDSIRAGLKVSALVNRHCCVVGSTGSGKSNLVAVLLRALAASDYRSARTLVVDPHGEYFSALPAESSKRVAPGQAATTERLRVPYWALSFDELIRITMGRMGEKEAEFVRDRVRELKVEAAQHLDRQPAEQAITADSPIPFSIRRLWWELEDNERMTFSDRDQNDETRCEKVEDGDPEALVPPVYPAASLGAAAPFLNNKRRGLSRQLELMRARLVDSRFAFMFDPSDGYHPDQEGRVEQDLDTLLANWLGGSKPITVLDVAAVPSEVLGDVVGSMLGLIYDGLFWGMRLPVGGKEQPLLLVLDEAHRFLPAGADTAASRVCGRIAREGRKYGVGLMAITQRPSDIDPTVLSQCGTMIALRVTNGADRGAVNATVPDDLGGLVALLPSLRTGEGLVLGEALQIPSRVRIDRAPERPVGDDPKLPDVWLRPRPDPAGYADALGAWRAQTTSPDLADDKEPGS